MPEFIDHCSKCGSRNILLDTEAPSWLYCGDCREVLYQILPGEWILWRNSRRELSVTTAAQKLSKPSV